MTYMIDGHNLIPKLGLRLDSMDDELELLSIVQEFCRRARKQAEVYFDGAPLHHSGSRKLGVLTAHFVPTGKTADNAIRAHLKRLRKSARNWIVVTSDRQVQAEARAVGAQTISSELFGQQIRQIRDSAPKTISDRKLSDDEVNEWLKLFEQKG